MRKPPFDLSEQFDAWFNELEGFSLRSERFESDLSNIKHGVLMTSVGRMELMTKWLRAAYETGVKDMADETLYTLGAYATAVSGIDEKCYTRAEAYDAASESLEEYYTSILN